MEPITYIIGHDRRVYAVFKDDIACEEHETLFPDHAGPACCGGFMNGLCVQTLWGM
jgi:hypothetical protein